MQQLFSSDTKISLFLQLYICGLQYSYVENSN